MSSRLRILCLHGFTSNGQVHAHQLRHITKALPEYDFLFPSAPHEVDINTQMDMTDPTNQAWVELVNSLSDVGQRAWWFARDGDWNDKQTGGFYGLEKSLDFIGTYLAASAPVHAICGFSQGACFAAMLVSLLQDKLADHPLRKHLPIGLATPKTGVIFSGFKARFPQYDSIYEPGIDVPLLHVIGERDPLVRSERSRALIQACHKSDFLGHPGAHDIPKNEEDRVQIVQYLRTHLTPSNSRGGQPSM